jgi:hypothetical protein
MGCTSSAEIQTKKGSGKRAVTVNQDTSNNEVIEASLDVANA